MFFRETSGRPPSIHSRLVNDFFSITLHSERTSHITIESNTSRRVPRIGGELNLRARWILTGLQCFVSGLVILTDEVALVHSLENPSSGQI
jgi:hypothetical protein